MNPIELADLYVEKYLYKRDLNYDAMYKEIVKPFSEDGFDKTSFLSYSSGRISQHIEYLNDCIEQLKKELEEKNEKDI